jgi:hypothetical protein
MNDPITIPKLSTTETDPLGYTLLRKQGVDYIIALGSKFWTDFNIHDPGITLLEALCYGLTDLGYRNEFSVADLLATPPGTPFDAERQGFFSARKILTVSPWTPLDYRKLLIDVVGLKNGWIFCKCCPCEMFLYAKCAEGRLVYEDTEHPVTIKGLYDVLLEFDEEPVGDLNSGKVKYNFIFPNGPATTATATIEMRLPSWHTIQGDLTKFKSLRQPDSAITEVKAQFISGNKNDNVDIPAAQLARGLRRPLYATIEIKFKPDKNLGAVETLALEDVPLTVWFRSSADRQALQLPDLKKAIEDGSSGGIAARYLEVLHRADEVVRETKRRLHAHRNLAEDFCSIDAVEVTDVAICLDLELRPDAEIERVLAEAYYQIGQYFAPSVRFYSLQELLAQGKAVDEIFNGPPLQNGFLDDAQLADTGLKSMLYASDVINILMDIEGVVAVRNFVFVPYDAEGFAQAPTSWSLEIPARTQPRLYIEGSKILVFKNKLSFLPDRQELSDTLQFIKGQNAADVLSATNLDLPVENGVYSDLTEYFPIQYSLPQTYGVGPEGLPPTANLARRGKAMQLKGYLFFFEQLFVNYLFQLKNIGELFAIDPAVAHSYFTTRIGSTQIAGIDEIQDASLTQNTLEGLIENENQWLDRRNRFLDQLLARFAEQFSDYALMLYKLETNKALTSAELIKDKIAFLKEYPFISANRGRSFNYKDPTHVCDDQNIAGLKRRIQLLLGFDPGQEVMIVEHLLLRPRNKPVEGFDGDPLLPVCISPDCDLCGEEDPYSFRLTIVLRGDGSAPGGNLTFRRFAEDTIRMETPAHLAVKVCWVDAAVYDAFQTAYCAWLAELAKDEPDPTTLSSLLANVITAFAELKNVYPPATLHDCFEGSEGNEVFLGKTVIPKNKSE